MSEAANNDAEDLVPETSDPLPERLPLWKKVRNWIFGAVALFIISSAFDAGVGLIFRKPELPKTTTQEASADWVVSLRDGNKYVIENVNALKPFTVAEVYYGYLLTGVPPPPLKAYLPQQDVPEILTTNSIGLLLVFIYRVIPGAIYTFITVASTGWVSAFTAIIALLFGYFAVRLFQNEEDSGSFSTFLLYLLLVPAIGCFFVWALIQLMNFAGFAFGRVLNAAETNATFSVLGTTVWAMFKKTENDVTDKFIKWTGSKLFK